MEYRPEEQTLSSFSDAASRATSSDRSWYDEIDLDPNHDHPTMGTRSLGDRPWLVADDLRDAELALKAELLSKRHGEVFAAGADSEPAGAETLSLVCSGQAPMPGLHPLDAAGRLVQEDLCLLSPGRDAEHGQWILAAASLCFPSRWRLADKIAKPMAAVHGPVDRYKEVLDHRVDSLFDRLGDRIVWRRNWFLHAVPDLFLPSRAPMPVISADQVVDGLFLRSERQTLRRLPESGWILFTIKTQHCPLGAFTAAPTYRSRVARFVAEASATLAANHGIGLEQMRELKTVFPASDLADEGRSGHDGASDNGPDT